MVESNFALTIGKASEPATGENGLMTEGPDGMVRTSAEVEAAQQSDLRSAWLQQNRSVLDGLGPQDRLAWAHQMFGEQLALTTSFGIQSSVLLHMLSQLPGAKAVPVIWVDTGYLTY